MKSASTAYKEQMKKPIRNHGYINVTIGVINQEAQKTASFEGNDLSYVSNLNAPLVQYPKEKIYASCENDFSKVDGSMVFVPRNHNEVGYNQGVVTRELVKSDYQMQIPLGFGMVADKLFQRYQMLENQNNIKIKVSFGTKHLDIKGFTIDFGEKYPTKLKIENDSGVSHVYENESEKFITEDTFLDTSYIIITPLRMVNTYGRVRIYSFLCGLGNVFTNHDVKNYTFKDYVSEICDSLPSQDVSITVLNSDLRYCVDNPNSSINFMEVGQNMLTSFGYELDDSSIEWVASNISYLKKWSADDSTAKFTGVDVLENMDGTYYKGKYRANGITAFDLAEDIFTDAGVEDYYIDPYLNKCLVYNPMPVLKHKEALQTLSNAFRCTLKLSADGFINLVSNFYPDSTAISNTETAFSNIENVLNTENKMHYAIASNNFSTVDSTMKFLPTDALTYDANTGYISSSCADGTGGFATVPSIILDFETAFTLFGININFFQTYATEIKFTTYNDGTLVDEVTFNNDSLSFQVNHEFMKFDKMVISFEQAQANTRVVVDSIVYGDITDYVISRAYDLLDTPTATKNDKLKSMTVPRYVYSLSSEEEKQLIQSDIIIDDSLEYTVTFSNASYGYTVTLDSGNCEIVDSSDFYVTVRCSVAGNNKITVTGKEYVVSNVNYVVNHNTTGTAVTWDNKLISTEEQAKSLEEWVADYYDDALLYEFKYRGDGRIEAGDTFFLELKDRDNAEIRSYQNDLTFNGGWSAKLKARRKN